MIGLIEILEAFVCLILIPAAVAVLFAVVS